MQPPALNGPILVCTLGVSWAVVPEAYALLAPDILRLYEHHPAADSFYRAARKLGLEPPAEVWVVTTGGPAARSSVAALSQCWRSLPGAPPLRVWMAAGTDNLASAEECERVRELTLRLCLHATARAGPERVVLCLAGGRKTMSADLQLAGSLFGCAAFLHVIDAGLPEELKKPRPEMLSCPLPAELVKSLFPVFLGPSDRSDLVDARDPSLTPAITPEHFPIPLGPADQDGADAQPVVLVEWTPSPPALVRAWEERERQKATLFAGHIKSLLEREQHANWFGLYRLPLRRIERLRTTRLGAQHREWLRHLPKADLHCHLGGVLDVRAQREVGRALWDELTRVERERAREAVSSLLGAGRWPPQWSEHLRSLPNRAAATAALLVGFSEEALTERLFAPTEPRIALRDRHTLGFRAYELPGELSGSALLQRETAVREYARQAYRSLRHAGIRYCELRGSPTKYLNGQAMRFLTVFRSAISESHRGEPGCDVRFIIVADRRRGVEQIKKAVDCAVRAHRDLEGFVVGLDLAGEEGEGSAVDELEQALRPAFEACLPITIHAGEGQPAESIWASVYRLHAERVGHGLTLHQRPDLAARLRDRDIAVELCPTSNVEVVGFRDPDEAQTEVCAEYPLRTYLRDLCLSAVICTDNPGISRTTLADEFLRAARMSGVLTVWEALALLRTGFEHAFAPASVRAELMREADAAVIEAIDRYDP
jgi:adenosine deaminase